MTDSWDWTTGLTERLKAEEAARAAAFREKVLPALQKKRLRTIVGTYSGSGDSGGVDYWSGTNKYGKNVPQGEWGLDQEQRGALEDYVLSLLPGGWEINDGSDGEATINLETGKVTIQHSERITTTQDSTIEGQF